jgi:hypothetical protein
MSAREPSTAPSLHVLIPLIAVPALTAIVLIITVGICAGVSALAAFGGLYSTAYALYLHWHWYCAYGEIVRYRITRDSDGHKVYHSVYRFTTLDGQAMIGTTGWGAGRRGWRLGQSVVLLYCPANPRRTELTRMLRVLPLTCFGLAVWAAAFAYWVEPFAP